VPCQGIVPALNHIVRAFTERGDSIIIQRPVYHPFTYAVERNGREVVSNTLIHENGRYVMDFADLEAKAKDPAAKMLIVCSPHNPVGRVWTADELRRMGEICMANDVLVVLDELHMDLILPGNSFTPYATLGPDFEAKAIFTTAPSKAFSLAGIHSSNILIPDETMREAFRAELMASGILGMNPLGIVSMEAAYSPEGAKWLDACNAYLGGNVDYLETALAERVPEIKLIRPEGTYLAWLDCRAFGLDKDALASLMLDDAKLFFDEGYIFGPEGEGFERINIACPRSLVERAVDRFERVARKFRQGAEISR
jgi:cystathionine beta-lyase